MGCDRREVVTAFRAEALTPVSCSACAQVLGLCSRVSLLMLGIAVTVSAGFLYERQLTEGLCCHAVQKLPDGSQHFWFFSAFVLIIISLFIVYFLKERYSRNWPFTVARTVYWQELQVAGTEEYRVMFRSRGAAVGLLCQSLFCIAWLCCK